jgi:L-lactate utilization protein LutC
MLSKRDPMSARKDIFSKIESALGSNANARPDKNAVDAIHAKLGWTVPTDLRAAFIQRVEESGGEAYHFSNTQELHAWLADFLKDIDSPRVMLAAHDMLNELDVHSQLQQYGCEIGETTGLDSAAITNIAEQSHIGIGTASAGFADCGAVLTTVSPQESRALSLLPDTHIVFLRESDLYPSMTEFSNTLQTQLTNNPASSYTFVGGPSKTADIEKTLVQGVHGPRRFVVCLI